MDPALERLEAVHEIGNLMGRLAYLHAANLHAEIPAMYALDTPGVRVEVPGGVYEGTAGIERAYSAFSGMRAEFFRGFLHMHTLTTPVIEVAADVQTAKAVWTCPGHAAGPAPGGGLEAAWVWTRYGCDFARENGTWKIWHLHIYGLFRAPYDTSWVRAQWDGLEPRLPPGAPAPDRPSTGWWMYRTDLAVPDRPAPPRAYQSFEPADAY